MTGKAPRFRAPSHLRPATRQWVGRVLEDYELEEHHFKLLVSAAESWDRMQEARRALATHGLTFTTARGVVQARPEVAMERDHKVLFARTLRELGLDRAAPPEEIKPPALSGLRVVGKARPS